MVKYAWGDNEFIILCWWREERWEDVTNLCVPDWAGRQT